MPVITYPITEHPVDGGVCFLCGKRDDGIGAFIPRRPPRIAFSCNEHVDLATKALNMSSKDYDFHDDMSMIEGLCCAGEYLDKLGETDFAKMSREEMIAFFKAFRAGHKKEMDRRLREHVAPF